MKPNIIVFPGSNCDRDVYIAIKSIIGTSPKMIWHKETSLENTVRFNSLKSPNNERSY